MITNWLSLCGILLVAASFCTVLCLMGVDLLVGFSSPYMGIFTYLITPGFLTFGLFLIVAGVVLERRRRRKLAPGQIPQFPLIDFNIPRQRNVFVAVALGAFVFLLLTGIGSYRSYQFTESVAFCGRLCHSVMNPEYTAYSNSPHARVTCTECHIGPGATWFARSKLSGTYQVYATIANIYPRPIPTPIKTLRPAQETCEQCHWPQKYFEAVERVRRHFLSDEKTSPWTIQMLIKVGGGDPTHGPEGGIHWHMNVANKIEYIAKDEAREMIPWVRATDREGRVTVFESKEDKLTPDQINQGPMRRMDCIDCHNRPTHIFRSPNESLDTSMWLGRIDPSIPFIKKKTAAALVQPHSTQAEGVAKISEKLTQDYAQYKDQGKIQAAIQEVQKIYRNNFFPEMKSNWRVHPDHIGHLNWNGCFRCHDGEHKSASGKVISSQCNTCHLIIGQGPGTKLESANVQGLKFQHPGEEVPEDVKCTNCHTGGPQD